MPKCIIFFIFALLSPFNFVSLLITYGIFVRHDVNKLSGVELRLVLVGRIDHAGPVHCTRVVRRFALL